MNRVKLWILLVIILTISDLKCVQLTESPESTTENLEIVTPINYRHLSTNESDQIIIVDAVEGTTVSLHYTDTKDNEEGNTPEDSFEIQNDRDLEAGNNKNLTKLKSHSADPQIPLEFPKTSSDLFKIFNAKERPVLFKNLNDSNFTPNNSTKFKDNSQNIADITEESSDFTTISRMQENFEKSTTPAETLVRELTDPPFEFPSRNNHLFTILHGENHPALIRKLRGENSNYVKDNIIDASSLQEDSHVPLEFPTKSNDTVQILHSDEHPIFIKFFSHLNQQRIDKQKNNDSEKLQHSVTSLDNTNENLNENNSDFDENEYETTQIQSTTEKDFYMDEIQSTEIFTTEDTTSERTASEGTTSFSHDFIDSKGSITTDLQYQGSSFTSQNPNEFISIVEGPYVANFVQDNIMDDSHIPKEFPSKSTASANILFPAQHPTLYEKLKKNLNENEKYFDQTTQATNHVEMIRKERTSFTRNHNERLTTSKPQILIISDLGHDQRIKAERIKDTAVVWEIVDIPKETTTESGGRTTAFDNYFAQGKRRFKAMLPPDQLSNKSPTILTKNQILITTVTPKISTMISDDQFLSETAISSQRDKVSIENSSKEQIQDFGNGDHFISSVDDLNDSDITVKPLSVNLQSESTNFNINPYMKQIITTNFPPPNYEDSTTWESVITTITIPQNILPPKSMEEEKLIHQNGQKIDPSIEYLEEMYDELNSNTSTSVEDKDFISETSNEIKSTNTNFEFTTQENDPVDPITHQAVPKSESNTKSIGGAIDREEIERQNFINKIDQDDSLNEVIESNNPLQLSIQQNFDSIDSISGEETNPKEFENPTKFEFPIVDNSERFSGSIEDINDRGSSWPSENVYQGRSFSDGEHDQPFLNFPANNSILIETIGDDVLLINTDHSVIKKPAALDVPTTEQPIEESKEDSQESTENSINPLLSNSPLSGPFSDEVNRDRSASSNEETFEETTIPSRWTEIIVEIAELTTELNHEIVSFRSSDQEDNSIFETTSSEIATNPTTEQMAGNNLDKNLLLNRLDLTGPIRTSDIGLSIVLVLCVLGIVLVLAILLILYFKIRNSGDSFDIQLEEQRHRKEQNGNGSGDALTISITE